MFIDIQCSCCKGEKGSVLYSGLTSVYSDQPWDLTECSTCKNIVTQPVPSKKVLDEIYNKTYLYPIHLLALGEKKFRSRAMANYLKKISFSGNDKQLLEVGCMYGYLLSELKNDFNVKGIEIGEEAVNFCRRFGLDVADISVEDYLLRNNEKFDLIILSHVFEHLLSPEKILEQLRDRLNPGSFLVISVPNSESFYRKLCGRYWGWWQVPVHINHFRESALRQMATLMEMKIEHVRFKGGDSLMLLLNFINLFGFRSKKSAPGFFQKSIIRIFTFLFRYWYYIGNEEMTVVIRKN